MNLNNIDFERITYLRENQIPVFGVPNMGIETTHPVYLIKGVIANDFVSSTPRETKYWRIILDSNYQVKASKPTKLHSYRRAGATTKYTIVDSNWIFESEAEAMFALSLKNIELTNVE